ncbi:HAD family hydrolase [Rubrivivax gelatinosus]|uniref:Phosphoglycolate phosphatase Gph n=1 Tax=Rubrivivax gelatinosus (strain NBRC 100245 / IL144) TaxID=983917 RepID=I0HNZ9_RUBGI|nr:HAD-IA family hydrolase [Rubrivivax gelatinosus]BAL94736.1 phosphoglycolate phosphatase Gph [Rubrivivax gelatinosus IL144]
MARAAAVLFDLDGTLVDSAPDLAGAANDLRVARGLEPLPYERLRPMVGTGARGMVGAAFGLAPGDEGFEPLRDAFLARYAERLLQTTRVFAAVEPMLVSLESAGLRWGIVTNKAMRYAEPVVRGLALDVRAAALIAGDTTPFSKPHPEPLFEAARRLALAPGDCVYVGDDHRDIVAGRAAGMRTLAAAWGYLGRGEPIDAWGADAVLENPAALLNWLELA